MAQLASPQCLITVATDHRRRQYRLSNSSLSFGESPIDYRPVGIYLSLTMNQANVRLFDGKGLLSLLLEVRPTGHLPTKEPNRCRGTLPWPGMIIG
jgi:hypothetical protein